MLSINQILLHLFTMIKLLIILFCVLPVNVIRDDTSHFFDDKEPIVLAFSDYPLRTVLLFPKEASSNIISDDLIIDEIGELKLSYKGQI